MIKTTVPFLIAALALSACGGSEPEAAAAVPTPTAAPTTPTTAPTTEAQAIPETVLKAWRSSHLVKPIPLDAYNGMVGICTEEDDALQGRSLVMISAWDEDMQQQFVWHAAPIDECATFIGLLQLWRDQNGQPELNWGCSFASESLC